MVALYPVSDSVHNVRSSVEIDAPNIGLELVYVPVRIQFHFHNSYHGCHLILWFKSPVRQCLYLRKAVRAIGASSPHP